MADPEKLEPLNALTGERIHLTRREHYKLAEESIHWVFNEDEYDSTHELLQDEQNHLLRGILHALLAGMTPPEPTVTVHAWSHYARNRD